MPNAELDLGLPFMVAVLTAIARWVHPLLAVESAEGGWALLRPSDEAVGERYRVVHRIVPIMLRELGEGEVGPTIAQAAEGAGAVSIVVGAGHPHAFGRFTDPDVVAYLRRHTAIPVHGVTVQTEHSQSTPPPADSSAP